MIWRPGFQEVPFYFFFIFLFYVCMCVCVCVCTHMCVLCMCVCVRVCMYIQCNPLNSNFELSENSNYCTRHGKGL